MNLYRVAQIDSIEGMDECLAWLQQDFNTMYGEMVCKMNDESDHLGK